MRELTIIERVVIFIKHCVYRVALPVYLWSIGYKSLDDYIFDILENERGEL